MNITDIRVRFLKKEDNKLKAVASIIIDDAFVVHDIKIIDGGEGCFIVMPSRKTPDGQYRDIAHPIRNEVREELKVKVLAAYDALVAGQQ